MRVFLTIILPANNGFHQTGLIIKKYVQLQFDTPDGYRGMFFDMYKPGSDSDSYQLWTAQISTTCAIRMFCLCILNLPKLLMD